MRLIFAFGISFQLPILLNLLARIGVVNSKYLKNTRRYVIVIIFTVAAILTPPDPYYSNRVGHTVIVTL